MAKRDLLNLRFSVLRIHDCDGITRNMAEGLYSRTSHTTAYYVLGVIAQYSDNLHNNLIKLYSAKQKIVHFRNNNNLISILCKMAFFGSCQKICFFLFCFAEYSQWKNANIDYCRLKTLQNFWLYSALQNKGLQFMTFPHILGTQPNQIQSTVKQYKGSKNLFDPLKCHKIHDN